MKTLMFVTGVSVGAITTVGVAVGSILIGLNKVSNGEVAKVVGVACSDLKDIMRGTEKE